MIVYVFSEKRNRHKNMADAAPASCARIKPGMSTGLMPENVFVKPRANVTAGFAKDVEEVNQKAARI